MKLSLIKLCGHKMERAYSSTPAAHMGERYYTIVTIILCCINEWDQIKKYSFYKFIQPILPIITTDLKSKFLATRLTDRKSVLYNAVQWCSG